MPLLLAEMSVLLLPVLTPVIVWCCFLSRKGTGWGGEKAGMADDWSCA